MRDGSRREANVRVHLDRRVQAVVEQTREAEMVQAIDRLRLIHSTREKAVFILCNIPLDIPVDELVTWRELAGDGRLAKTLQACKEEGWMRSLWRPKSYTACSPSCGVRRRPQRIGSGRTRQRSIVL